jgi:polysaccharide deacetylase 2 family uncharacterized protein YibQ
LASAVVAGVLIAGGYAVGRWTASARPASPAPPIATASPIPTLGTDAVVPLAATPTAVTAGATPPPTVASGVERGAIAVLIDDLGRSVDTIDRLAALGVPLGGAVLPFEPRTAEVAARLAERGLEVLCHLPMEALAGEDPGPGALDVGMRPRRLRAATRRALDAVPGAVGVNNHMGSALSEDREAMTAVLEVVRARELFFVDSRTSPNSVGYRLARDLGVPAAERKVFLDGDRDPSAIRSELRRLLEIADRGAPAIAIGHP